MSRITAVKHKLVRRIVGVCGGRDLVVRLDEDGIELRAAGRRRAVLVAWRDVAALALDLEGYAARGTDPLAELAELARQPPNGRRPQRGLLRSK